MTSPRKFFLLAAALGLAAGSLIQWASRTDAHHAQLWLDNLTSPLGAWMRYRDCARVAEGLTEICQRAHALADPVVAAAEQIEQEQSSMQGAVHAWRSRQVFSYAFDGRLPRLSRPEAQFEGEVALARESDEDDLGDSQPALQMAPRITTSRLDF